jgi:uncharacterized protein YceK
MKIVYVNLMILFILAISGCSNVGQSSYNNDSAIWQKAQSQKALQDLEKE